MSSAHRDDHGVCPCAANVLDRSGNNGLGEAGQFDDLAEYGPEQEYRQVELDETDQLFHEDTGKDGCNGVGLDQQHSTQRRDRGKRITL